MVGVGPSAFVAQKLARIVGYGSGWGWEGEGCGVWACLSLKGPAPLRWCPLHSRMCGWLYAGILPAGMHAGNASACKDRVRHAGRLMAVAQTRRAGGPPL